MSAFTGSRHLVRLAVRRDRLRLGLWTLGLVGVSAASASAVQSAYDTPEKVATYGPTAGESAASKITSGRQAALDTIDGITANEITMIATLGVTLLVVFTVIRHTRAEEESGAAELVRSGVVGRHAATLAALVVALSTAILISLLLTVSLIGIGLDPVGSIAFGAALALLGLLFAGIAVAAAQMTASARGALAIAGGLLGAAYVVRGVGAVADNWLYWTSPFGWAQGIDAYADERWWILGVLLVGAIAAFALTVLLTSRRDAGAGLLQPRPGDARASRSLGTVPGLAWRTQRGLVIGWSVGLAALAAIYASVLPEVPKMFEDNPDLLDAMGISGDGDSLIDAFLGYINLTLGVIGSVFGVASVLRMRAEEDSGRMEALVATPVTRGRWARGWLTVSIAGVLVMGLAMGVGMVLGYLPVAHDTDRSGELFLGILAQLPAMFVVAAVAFVVITWVPRFAIVAWVFVIWVVLESFLAETLKLPDAVRFASPFFHLSTWPAESWSALPALSLLAVAAVLVGVGFVGLRRRDLG